MASSNPIDRILDLGFLGAIAREDLRSLKPAPELLTVKAGDTLIWQGETGRAYYLLLRGRLRRFVNDEHGGRRFVGDVVPGQGVGASGLLTDEGYAATVRVMHDSEVVRFPKATFLQMMVLSWEFAIGVSKEQIERVRMAAASAGRHPTIKNVAVVPMDATLDLKSFLDGLVSAIEPLASVTSIDRKMIDTQAGPGAASTKSGWSASADTLDIDTVVYHLEALEHSHEIVLYPVSSTVDSWTRLIVDRADLVLLVTSVGGTSDPCDIETVLIEPTEDELLPRIDLVVMHGNDWDREVRTRRWLDVRDVDEWHHIRTGRREDYQRLARVLTGNAIILVLGGGGARGLAEIGVFKALREAGIPIDRYAGTSMGAMIGAMFACGRDPDDVTNAVRTWAEKGRPGRDYTLPLLSLVHGKKLHDAAHEMFGDGHIEDLPIPFFCLSADLSEIKAVVHDRGSLWRSVRASMSVPGIGPPLFDDGRVLSDGGTATNVPADVVAQRHAGRIIIVVVTLSRKLSVPRSYNDLVPSGWEILWHRINPFLEPLEVPSIYEILQRASAVGSNEKYREARQVADLAILPPVSWVGLLDFHEIDKLIQIGYDHTVAQLDSIGKQALQKLFPGSEIIQSRTEGDGDLSPPIDRSRFNEILGVDDDATFHEMLGLFIELFPHEIENLATTIAKGESAEIHELARRAKSAAINVAAPALTAQLQVIENKARNGETDGLQELVNRVRTEFSRIETYSHQS